MKKAIVFMCLLALCICIGCGSVPAEKTRDSVSRDEIKKRSDSATRELDSVVE